jgi:Asp-tRNA(Asn)/Glu-tRNA(Gln) amidotransferase A subunit family amidase
LRIGFVRHFHEEDMPADPEVTAALEHVALTLQTLGAEIRDVRLPTLGEFAAVNRVILQSEAWAIHGQWLRERPGDYGQLARRRLMSGAFLSAGDYVQAARRRLEMIGAVEAALRDVDILLCASGRAHLPAAGSQAVQCHRPSRASDNEWSFIRRSAAVGAVCRPVFRRGDTVSSRARMGARGWDGE